MHYLDNAATTWPKPESVYTTADETFRALFSPKRGSHKASRAGGQKLDNARQTLATLFGITNPQRIAFTPGATYALNAATQGYPWQAGDAVVMSAIEHHALSRPIRKLARERGVTFHVVPYTDDVPFDMAAYKTLLETHSTIRMVAVTHASNVIGSILPIHDIFTLAHQHGKTTVLDAAQSAGVLPINVIDDHIDMLAVPGHKGLYGPPGVGMLYVAEGVPLGSFAEGGTGGDSGKHPMTNEQGHINLPDGAEVGTLPLPLMLAMAEGANWVTERGISTIHTHECTLLQHLLDGLNTIEGITIYGHQNVAHKTPVVSFNLAGHHPKELGNTLFDEAGIALRGGFHCAPMAHEAIGSVPHGGTLRASIGATTSQADVDVLISALNRLR